MVDSQTDTRASHWSITINNPTEADRIAIRTQPRWLRKVKWQDEQGENGTVHIQAYANTDQVRMSALKKWLTRAHFKPCFTQEHIENTLDYAHKQETAIANTQHELTYRTREQPSLTMSNLLTNLAEFAYSAEQIRERLEGTDELPKMKLKEIYESEYWHAVSMMISQDPDLIQTFTMPCYKIAWVNTRQVWLQKYLVDSQTNIRINTLDSGEISPVSV